MTGKGGDWVLSIMTGIRPFGLRRRNQSFFCSLVMMLLKIVSRSRVECDRRESINVHQSGSPFCAVDLVQLFEHNLYFLAIGGTLSDEVKSLWNSHQRRF